MNDTPTTPPPENYEWLIPYLWTGVFVSLLLAVAGLIWFISQSKF